LIAYEFAFALNEDSDDSDALDSSAKTSHFFNAWRRHYKDNTEQQVKTAGIADSIYSRFHTAREVRQKDSSANGAPLSFTFPGKADGLQDYHYDPSSMVVASQDPGIFQLPEGCAAVICGKESVRHWDSNTASAVSLNMVASQTKH
jgi:hypothetical protein